MSRWRPPGPLGLGGAPLGNLFSPVPDADAAAAIEAAWDEGLRFFDTAPLYGLGLSESRMGAALAAKPAGSFSLATKVGRLIEADPAAPEEQHGYAGVAGRRVRFDYSADGARRSVEDSLRRLGLPRVDAVLIHDVAEDTHGAAWREAFDAAMAGAACALTRMREEGAIRAWGLGVNDVTPCLRALQRADPDLFLIAGRYSLLDGRAAEALIPACADRGASLIIGGPYNSGLLAGGGTFDYAPAPPAMVARRDAIARVCDAHHVPLRAAALQFCTAPDVVACVIPGARSAAEVRDNAAMMRHPIPPALWDDLRAEGLLPA